MIRMYLSDQILSKVSTENTVRGLWEKLKKISMDKNMTNKLWLKKQLYNLPMSKRGDLVGHIQRFN